MVLNMDHTARRWGSPWQWAGVALVVLAGCALAGCGEERAATGPATATSAPTTAAATRTAAVAPAAPPAPVPAPAASALAPIVTLPPALCASLTRRDAPCHLDVAMLRRPIGQGRDRVDLALDPAQDYGLSLSKRAICRVSADDVEVRYSIDPSGRAAFVAVTLNGRPAVLRTSEGKAVLVGPCITLRLDAHGLNTVELPGDGGAMLAVPSAWFGPSA